MTKTKIRNEITTVLLEMGIPAKAITTQASYYKDLGLDSLDFTELIMECELRFGVAINCTDTDHLKTVKDTVDYISQVINFQVVS